ncbi:retropepsin-like aspartic protease family protein, partial [Kaarinaea lacus]
LLELHLHLTAAEPDYPYHYVNLAESYLQLGNSSDAMQALALVADNPEVANVVAKMQKSANESAAIALDNAITVPLIAAGSHFLISTVLNHSIATTLLLDTGASLTVISPAALHNLGLSVHDAQRYGWFNTANGVTKAPVFLLNSLTIGDQRVENIEVAVMEIPSGKNIDGLLGMNFLKHFKFYIDQNNATMYLSTR